MDEETESLKEADVPKTIEQVAALGPELSSSQKPCHSLTRCINICVPTIRFSIAFPLNLSETPSYKAYNRDITEV